MKTIKVQVRIDGAGTGNERPVMFWRDGYNLCCFTWFDGHNTACDEYRLSLPPSRTIDAVLFVADIQRHYDSLPGERVGLQPVQRLPRQ